MSRLILFKFVNMVFQRLNKQFCNHMSFWGIQGVRYSDNDVRVILLLNMSHVLSLKSKPGCNFVSCLKTVP